MVKPTAIRKLVQWASIAALLWLTYFLYNNPMGGCWLDPFWHMQDLFATKGAGSMIFLGLGRFDLTSTAAAASLNSTEAAKTLTTLSPYVIVGVFIIFVLLLGRLFCGWICPYGTFLDVVEKVSPIKGKMEMPRDLKDKHLKYVILAGAFILALIVGYTSFCDYCPAGVLLKESAGGVIYTAIPVFAIITLLVFAYGRKVWCSYLCPLGGFMALLNKYHLLPIRPKGECIKCQTCDKNCPMDVLVAEDYIQKGKAISDSECIKCMKCVESCPKKILAFP
jgi:ferredoxin-type protein NapH